MQADACTEAAALEEHAFAQAVRRAIREEQGEAAAAAATGGGNTSSVLDDVDATGDDGLESEEPPRASEVVAMPDEPVEYAHACAGMWPPLVRRAARAPFPMGGQELR